MANFLPTDQFPDTSQDDFARIPRGLLPGSLFEGDLHSESCESGLIARVTPVALTGTVTIAANNPGDTVGVFVDGGIVSVIAGANADATAALLGPAILAASFTDELIDTANFASNVVTLGGVLGANPVVTEYAPDTTTATVVTVPATVQQELCWGMGVVRDVPTNGVNTKKIRKPTSLTDDFAGVLVRTSAGALTPNMLLAAGFDPNFLPPGRPHAYLRARAGIVVQFIGDLPLEGDDAYFIMEGSGAGYWSSSDGGTSQVTQGDVEFNATDVVGLTVDALPDLTVASNTSDDQTATDLRDAWNASAQHLAVATALIDLSGAESLIILAFNDTAIHTVVAVSPATADVVAITNTATAVAANARLIADYSWARPSIKASADLPARAFLRLSNP